jgi:hypothetical protein
VHDVEFPFLDYKKGSNIDRVLVKCKYKSKVQDDNDEKVQEIIKRENSNILEYRSKARKKQKLERHLQ